MTQKQTKRDYHLLQKMIPENNIDFYVLDVETANRHTCSICQIGIVGFNSDGLVQAWSSYIDPEDEFSGINIGIHGITAEHVSGSPDFPAIHGALSLLENQIVIQHTGFDKASLGHACRKYGLPELNFRWIDSALVAKRTWQDVSRRGYGLGDLSKKLGFTFVHHDAVEDALVTGEILLKAIEDSGINLEEWEKAVKKPVRSFYS